MGAVWVEERVEEGRKEEGVRGEGVAAEKSKCHVTRRK